MVRTLLIVASTAIITTIVVLFFQNQPFRLHPAGMSYADFAATLLGASAVLLTIIGIFIAALAIWGFNALRSLAKVTAKNHVAGQLQQGEIRSHIEGLVRRILTEEFDTGGLRVEFERRLDEIILTSASRRARQTGASEDDVPVGDV